MGGDEREHMSEPDMEEEYKRVLCKVVNDRLQLNDGM